MAKRKKRPMVDWKERIGVEFITNEECQARVVDYQKRGKKPALYQVVFLDEHKFTTWSQWANIEKGAVKNPYHRSVFGVGYLGVDKNGEVPNTTNGKKIRREYVAWANMLERCYSDKQDERHPSYENCTVCERWQSFANFLEDIDKIKNYEYWRDNPQQRIALNKDMYYSELGIDTDCKEYNLETARFISQSDNSKERMSR